ncbi:hypothetical protein [endosymbiont of Lamellibrachia barhami]|uniref:hypothetical protein n=1 Tax=endosymbiont of Lamellibrachia barhami TaxID=205975 RepID=UPI0015AB7EAC|nr:hypothetical protein [endosymbiont of Lamellibrachia barhami]
MILTLKCRWRSRAGGIRCSLSGDCSQTNYLPRRKTRIQIHEDELVRVDNPLKKEALPTLPEAGETLDDVAW